MVNNKCFMPVPALCARESEDKDTAKTVNFNVLLIFFSQKRKKILYLCSAYRLPDGCDRL